MEISDVRNTLMASALMQVQTQDGGVKDSLTKTTMGFGGVTGSGAEISKPSELLSRLEQIQNEDPEKFSEIMTEIAEMLQQTSEELEETGSEEAGLLAMLASVFGDIAETGDLSLLQPAEDKAPPPPPMDGQAGVSETTATCSNCGASVPANTATCPMCGMGIQSLDTIMQLGENEDNDTEATIQQAEFMPPSPPPGMGLALAAITQYNSDTSTGSSTSVFDELLGAQQNSESTGKSISDLLAQLMGTKQDSAV